MACTLLSETFSAGTFGAVENRYEKISFMPAAIRDRHEVHFRGGLTIGAPPGLRQKQDACRAKWFRI